jgi:hypothetical protein
LLYERLRSMRAFAAAAGLLYLACWLLPAGAQESAQAIQAADEAVKVFERLLRQGTPRSPADCRMSVLPARRALMNLQMDYPKTLTKVADELQNALYMFAHECDFMSRGNTVSWSRPEDNIKAARAALEKERAKLPPPPAPPAPAAVQPSQPAPSASPETPPPAEAQKEEPKKEDKPEAKPSEPPAQPAETPKTPAPPAAAGDPKLVEKMQGVIRLVQKLDSAFDLGMAKDLKEDRLLDAHAELQDFAGSPEAKLLPQTVASLRLALAYFRRGLGADDTFALTSAKEALQKARDSLQYYEAHGREPAPPS